MGSAFQLLGPGRGALSTSYQDERDCSACGGQQHDQASGLTPASVDRPAYLNHQPAERIAHLPLASSLHRHLLTSAFRDHTVLDSILSADLSS